MLCRRVKGWLDFWAFVFFSKGFRLWNHGAGKSCLSAESPIEVDCGTCLCVPLTSCQWCPGAYSPSRPSRPSPAPAPAPINSRPSTVPGCPASYADCGTCLCVPQTTCRWCPGATAPAPALPAPSPTPVPAPSPIQSRPSTVPGCPASYKDCGTCPPGCT